MPSSFSIKLGDLLYKHAFPIYNFIYPIFKRRQDKTDIAMMEQYIKPGNVVLDIGANIGFYTKILSKLVGNTGRVYAFEPDKTNYHHLLRNAAHLKNVVFHNKAASDHTGTITLYHSDLLNVDHKTYATDNYTSKTEIDGVAMDDIIPNQKVDFIKIDIQGFEYFAFKGMQKIFDTNPDLKIITEFYPLGMQNANVDYMLFFQFLWDNHFTVYKTENGSAIVFTEADIDRYTAVKDTFTFVDLFIEKNKNYE